MTLTPRQIAAWLEFNQELDRVERADALMIAAIGAQGDKKAIEKTLNEIQGQSRSAGLAQDHPRQAAGGGHGVGGSAA